VQDPGKLSSSQAAILQYMARMAARGTTYVLLRHTPDTCHTLHGEHTHAAIWRTVLNTNCHCVGAWLHWRQYHVWWPTTTTGRLFADRQQSTALQVVLPRLWATRLGSTLQLHGIRLCQHHYLLQCRGRLCAAPA